MALASGRTRRMDIPHEPGEWLELREMGDGHLRPALERRQEEVRRNFRQLGGEIYDVIRQPLPQRTGPVTKPDPLVNYDVPTLLDRGVAGWSYDTRLPARSEDSAQQRERREVLDSLDPKTTEWAARAILALAGVENAWNLDDGAIEVGTQGVEDERIAAFPTVSASSWDSNG